MMRRAVPLIVNVFVATFASLRLHEIFGRNQLAIRRLRGTGKEPSLRSVAFLRHIRRGNLGIADQAGAFPALHPKIACPETQGNRYGKDCENLYSKNSPGWRKHSTRAQPTSKEQKHAGK